MAKPTFDVIYTLLSIPHIRPLFPPLSFDALLCHDDMTFIAPPYRAPHDDPKLRRLQTTSASDEELQALIRDVASSGVSYTAPGSILPKPI